MASDYRQSTDPTVQATRGIRNNNPGNIKIKDAWQGLAGDDGTFDIFADMSWGARAVAVSLSNMIARGVNTITNLVNTWAPASDSNNDAAYIASVSADTGIDPDATLSADPQTLALLVRAIANHENGDDISNNYLTDQDIADGVAKANGTVTSFVQSLPVYAIYNPIEATAIAALAVWGLYQIFKPRR